MTLELTQTQNSLFGICVVPATPRGETPPNLDRWAVKLCVCGMHKDIIYRRRACKFIRASARMTNTRGTNVLALARETNAELRSLLAHLLVPLGGSCYFSLEVPSGGSLSCRGGPRPRG